jgi:hypothetical protein
MRRRRIALLGTVINDTIHSATGEVSHALGGVLYTILPLRAFLPVDVEIVPLLHVGRDLHARVLSALAGLPNLSTRHVTREEQENTRVDLHYHSAEERTEIATGRVPPVSPEEVERLGRPDLLLVNFVSGWELSLAAMTQIAGMLRGRIHADLHSLVLGRASDGTRYYRKPYGWKKWLAACDTVQVNEREAKTLTGVTLDGSGEGLAVSLEQAADRLHACGPARVAVTLGARGAYLSLTQRRGALVRELRPGEKVEKIIDPTGSGDVFLAAFAAALFLGKEPCGALAFAVRTSAMSTAMRGAEGLYEYFHASGIRP